MAIDLYKEVKCMTVSFSSRYAHIQLFEILEMYFIVFRQINFNLRKYNLGHLYHQLRK